MVDVSHIDGTQDSRQSALATWRQNLHAQALGAVQADKLRPHA
jgi:hypothetical protein